VAQSFAPSSPAAKSRRDLIAATAASLKVKSARGSRVIEIQCDSADAQLTAAFLICWPRSISSRQWNAAGKPRSIRVNGWNGSWMKPDQTGEIRRRAAKLCHGHEPCLYRRQRPDQCSRRKTQRAAEGTERRRSGSYRQTGALRAGGRRTFRFDRADCGRSFAARQRSEAGDLRRQLAEETQTAGPANVRVKKLQAQIAQTESDQKKVRDTIVERIYNDFREAQRREKLLSAEYQAQSAVLPTRRERLRTTTS